jgi:hypothetical protein
MAVRPVSYSTFVHRLWGLGFIFALSVMRSYAAEVTVAKVAVDPSSDRGETVLIKLIGEIHREDASMFVSKVEPFLHPVYTETETRGNVVLFLNSPGGHYNAGIDIAQFVRSNKITTFVSNSRVTSSPPFCSAHSCWLPPVDGAESG